MYIMENLLCFTAVLCCAFSNGVSSDELITVDLSNAVATIPRIVGGIVADISYYPYTVQLAQNGRLVCGGSLVSRRHVLTAAHCLINWTTGQQINPSILSIRAGSNNLNSGGQTASVSLYVIQEGYNMVTQDADVAVLVLQSQVTLGQNVDIAALPVQHSSLPYSSSMVHVGWGTTVSGGSSLSPVLLQVVVQKVNWTVCDTRYRELVNLTGRPYSVTTNMICAGLLGIGGADACQGDSGGPLIALVNNTPVVVGVTSWGEGCGHPTYPGVSARVANFTNWINDVMARYNSAPTFNMINSIILFVSLFISMTLKF